MLTIGFLLSSARCFSAPDPEPSSDDASCKPVLFQILAKASGSSRPKLLDCSSVEYEITRRAPLAFLVQYFQVWTDADGEFDVFAYGSPQWIYHHSLLPQGVPLDAVTLYKDVTISEFSKCVTWKGGEPCIPTMPLTDDRCPTIWLIRNLLTLGWTNSVRSV